MLDFQKVPFDQFSKDYWQHLGPERSLDDPTVWSIYDQLKTPQRATDDSAGYDLHSPVDFVLCPGETIMMPLGFRIILPIRMFFFIAPRSGQGSKFFLRLANTTGIIDPGHAHNKENKGSIYIKLRNEFWGSYSDPNCCLKVSRGQAIAQGIFLPYFLTDSDQPKENNRLNKEGFGSTG